MPRPRAASPWRRALQNLVIMSHHTMEIASDFIQQAPPGGLHEVYNDLRHLVNDDNHLRNSTAQAMSTYNISQMTQVTLPSGAKSLVTRFNVVEGDNVFYDSTTGATFAFDHFTHEVSAGSGSHAPISGFLAELERAAKDYLNEYYPDGHATVSVFPHGDGAAICFASDRYSPRNFWNGRWRSEWILSGSSLKGEMRAHVHYYEDGNVQLQTKKKADVHVADAKNASAVVKAILAAEQAFQQGLNQSHSQLGDTTFKALRRALPITRNRVDWEKIALYKVGSQIGGK
ncbi:hypothetical protein H696_02977 [Fonticula alba]|uniref:F-actin-capping protein subunit alpha n=1 Tax=Fonticula alba TaxID=691883 RepID=A0A058Z8N9_FONAL|nr:hypothetical protein H696_02977 [Fonticula alba]KCV70620.1 hypothetical protein H696_02977 [Fonticula alba]|eukprot:XP_009495136.1 hypothetical protein H696_02977 [Fonticula alba]